MSNVPKLRFKEFSGEWELKQLSKVCELKAGKFVKATDISNIMKANMFPCYGGNGLRGYTNTFTHNGSYSLIGRQGALCGNIQFANNKFHATEHAVVVTPFDENDTLWLYYQLDRLNLNKFATGQAQPGLSVDVIKNVKAVFPLKPEQEKIASFLTSVDTKIEQLTKKESLLQEYKKGVMQKIFNQEIRFKADDESEFCEWEKEKLENIGEIITGKTPSTTNINLWNGDIKFITPTDIDDNVKYQNITQRTVVKQNKMKVLPIGSIIYTCIASIGKMQLTVHPSITNQQINSIIVNNNYNNEFIYYSLLYMTPYIKSTQSNTTLPIINKTEFSKFIVGIPPIQEQTKIANFLSSIDKKIQNTKNELEKTKEFKKALLQQMFV